MTRSTSLRTRLERLSLAKPIPRKNDDDEAGRRLRAAIAAEFGIGAKDVFRGECPALNWLHRIWDGDATSAELALFERIASTVFFEGRDFSTADYLRSISKIYREF